MAKSKIEWTDRTWNPITGCTKVSEGCRNCYAEREFPRSYKRHGREFNDVKEHEDRMLKPLSWTKSSRVFVNSMSDLFHKDVSDKTILRIFNIMELAATHQFQVLTKRPDRMRKWLKKHTTTKPANNIWIGVSVEDQETADDRISILLDTPAAVRWISAEPLLGPIDFNAFSDAAEPFLNLNALSGLRENPFGETVTRAYGTKIDWVIVGGESGPRARPMNPDWVHSILKQCWKDHVPFFFKQWGEWAPHYPGKDWEPSDKTLFEYFTPSPLGHGSKVWKMGKKAAGRILDDRTWDQYPS